MKRKTKKTCLLLLSLNLLCSQAAPALTLMAQENTELPAPGQDIPAVPEDAADQNPGNNAAGSGTAPDNPAEDESTPQNPEPDPQAPAPENPTPADPAEETDPETDEKEENGSPFTETADGLQYVLEDGTVVTGWFTLEGRTYYADPQSGLIQMGEKEIETSWYYFDPEEEGAMATGFVLIPAAHSQDKAEKHCYFDPETGIRQSGWIRVDGKYYNFLRSSGRQFFKEVTINGNEYYLDPEDNGAMAEGFVTIPAEYSREGYAKTCYYFPGSGARAAGWTVINGKTYNFYSKDGRQFTGDVLINGVRYYLDPEDNGAMAGGVTHVKAAYSQDGKYHIWFYGRTSGARQSGWIYDGDAVYNFRTTGYDQVLGEARINGTVYFFDPADNGNMATGEAVIPAALSDTGKDKHCLFGSQGNRISGWTRDGDSWRFWDRETGELHTSGWLQDRGKTYYLDDSGHPLTGLQVIEGKTHYFNADGAALSGWQKIDGRWYLFDDAGISLTGWQKVNGKWYWMDSQGVMASSRWIGPYYVLSDGSMAVSRIIDNTWYVDSSGLYIKNGTAVVGARKYGFGPTGRMQYSANLDASGNVASLYWNNVTYYSQRDPRWAGERVGKYLFDGTGCGPTSAAMVMQTLYQQPYSPLDLGRYFVRTTTFNQAQPGMWGREFKVMEKDYGNKLTITKDHSMIASALKNGDLVIIPVTRCLFAWYDEHFVVMAGYDNGATFVRDAYTPDNDGKWYNLDYMLNHMSDDSAIFRNPAVTPYH